MRFGFRLFAAWIISVCGFANAMAQTAGQADLKVTLLDYNGSGTRHWTVVWVTTGAGAFIKTLRKQGPASFTSNHWNDHCGRWFSAKGSSSALDGYTSATAQNYTGTNNPVGVTWDGRDATGQLMADGDYKFWVQYAEDSGQGPYTTSGLLWSKRAASLTNSYPNQGANFAGMQVVWTPRLPPVPPRITSFRITTNWLTLTGTGPTNSSYTVLSLNSISQTGSWMPMATNTFDQNGNFIFTSAVESNSAMRFYRLRVP